MSDENDQTSLLSSQTDEGQEGSATTDEGTAQDPAPSSTEGTVAPDAQDDGGSLLGGATDGFTEIDKDFFEIPEGYQALADEFDGLVTIVNEAKLPKSVAGKIRDFHFTHQKKLAEAGQKVWSETRKQWRDQVKSDQEIGGDKLDTNLKAATKLISEHGSPELMDYLVQTGGADYLPVIKFLSKIASKVPDAPAPTEGNVVNLAKPADRLFRTTIAGGS